MTGQLLHALLCTQNLRYMHEALVIKYIKRCHQIYTSVAYNAYNVFATCDIDHAKVQAYSYLGEISQTIGQVT